MRLRSCPFPFARRLALGVATAIFVGGAVVREPQAADAPQPAGRDAEVEILSPGVRLTRFADDSELVTPTGIDVDQQGNVWVVATHTHFRPEDYDGPEHDEVLVLTDTDGDGKADRRRVFYNATVATMDLALGPDGWVYLAERSRILRVRDGNGDGIGDVVEDLAVLETEADYPHNGLSGLAWHPGGDLMFGLGENYAKPWTLTGTDGVRHRGTGEGGVFRCSPDGKRLHRVARGFWNPFGVTVRDDGEIFAVDNDPGSRPPCRLLHVVEGGDYGYQRRYGNDAHHPFVCWNGELRGTLPMLHPTGEAPCGVRSLGDGLLATTWTDHRIDFYPLRRHGASFETERVVLAQGGNRFRPVCIAPAPSDEPAADDEADLSEDGVATFFFTDWVDVSYQLHGHGRVWKLEIDLDRAGWVDTGPVEPPNEAARLAAALRSGTASLDQDATFALVRDDDPFLAQAALEALIGNAAGWEPEAIESRPATDRATAVMALKSAARRGTPGVDVDRWIGRLLRDDDPEVRYETLRWIADEELTGYLPDVEEMLRGKHLDYRSFEALMATWNTLSGRPGDGVRDSAKLTEQVLSETASPRLRGYALRLLPTIPRQAADDGSDPTYQLPKAITADRLRELIRVGDEGLSLEAVRVLAGLGSTRSREILAEVAGESAFAERLRAEAIAGMSRAPGERLEQLTAWAGSPIRPVREEALRVLRVLPPERLDADRLAGISEHYPESGDLVRAAIDRKTLSEGRPDSDAIDAWVTRLGQIDAPADVAAGGRIFHHSPLAMCASCHRHSGRGNVVGPDLSRVGRGAERRHLAESLLQPNRQVAPEYRARMLVLHDGQTFAGIHLRTGGAADVETLRDRRGQERRFVRDEIEMSRELTTSLMPDGLADSLTDRELRDLIAFLEASR